MQTASGVPSRTIRVLLAEVPGLMGALVERSIAAQTDMCVVGRVRGAADLENGVSSAAADVVVTSLATPDLPVAYRELFFSESPVPILAISGDGRLVEVYGRRIVREIAPDQLVSVIREVADHCST